MYIGPLQKQRTLDRAFGNAKIAYIIGGPENSKRPNAHVFTTFSPNEVVLADMQGEIRTWVTVELHLEICWFFCSSVPDNSKERRSYFVSDPSQVADLAANKDEADKYHVTIATPPHVNGSLDWRFQRLKSIWLCQEPAVPQHAWIYETAQGDAYAHSLLGTRASALKRIQPLYSDS